MLARKLSQPEFANQDSDGERYLGYLQAVTLFTELRDIPGALEELSRVMQMKVYKPESPILVEGQTGAEMFFLVEGEASVYKSTAEGDQYRVAILHGSQGVFFGESGLLDSDARSATITADTECHCLVLDRAAFDSFCRSNPQWGMPVVLRIARAVMGRLRKTNNDLMLVYNALVTEIRGH